MTSKEDADFLNEISRSLFGEAADDLLAKNNGAEVDLFEFFRVRQLEDDLGLPGGFFRTLVEEDDWSFVIKLHALIEAAATHLLVETIDKPSLQDVFSRLDMGNAQVGKLAFMDNLGLISKDAKRFIRNLSELRNDFVHNVSNVDVDLIRYIEQLPEARRKGTHKAFGWGLPGRQLRIRVQQDLYDATELMKLFAFATFSPAPKVSIWFGAMLCLDEMSRHVLLARIDKEQQQYLDEALARLAALRRAQRGTEAYALRGEPIEYVNPFGSVAEEDWDSTN